MKIGSLFVILTASLFYGCAPSYNVKPVPQKHSKVQYKQGHECLVSQKQHVVSLGPQSGEYFRSKGRGSFVVAVHNRSKEEFIFSTENISASYTNEAGEQIEIQVMSYEDLVAEEKRRQAWAVVGASMQAMGDSMNAANAGYSNTYGSYSGNTYSSYGNSYNHYGSYSSTTYNYAAAQQAQNAANARTQQNMRNIAEDARRNNKRLANTILRKHTMTPGEWHGGEIQFKIPRLSTFGSLSFKVNVGSELHEFTFKIEKEQRSYRRPKKEQTVDQNQTKQIEKKTDKSIPYERVTEPKKETKKVVNFETAKKELFQRYRNGEITKEEYFEKYKVLYRQHNQSTRK